MKSLQTRRRHLKVDIFDKLADVRLERRDCQGLGADAAELHRAKPAMMNMMRILIVMMMMMTTTIINMTMMMTIDHHDDDLTVSSSFGGRVVCFPFKASILCSSSST